jgi:effector-binding domain-containing protein
MHIERVQLEPRTVAGVRETVAMNALTDFFGRAYETTSTALAQQGAFPTGAPIAIYHGTPTTTADITAGFPVGQPVTPDGAIVTETLPGGPAAQTMHIGSYDDLATTYSALVIWFADQSLTAGTEMWEEYLVGPDSEPDPSHWQTRIVWLL